MQGMSCYLWTLLTFDDVVILWYQELVHVPSRKKNKLKMSEEPILVIKRLGVEKKRNTFVR